MSLAGRRPQPAHTLYMYQLYLCICPTLIFTLAPKHPTFSPSSADLFNSHTRRNNAYRTT